MIKKTALKILWVLPYSPWPVTSGGKSRQFHLLRTLAGRGHKITLLIQNKTPLEDGAAEALSFASEIIYFQRRPLKSPRTILSILFSPYPMLVCVNGFNKRLRGRFQQLLTEKWDVIQLEHSYSAEPYFNVFKRTNTPYILTEHNVESGLGGATYDRFPSFFAPLKWWDIFRYQRWEKKVMKHAATTVAVTEQDAAHFKRISNCPSSTVVNGVDVSGFSNVEPLFGGVSLLFVGNYEYPPNIDAVEWLVTSIMPNVWAVRPEVKLLICGYGMPERWRQDFADLNIEWRGFVDDLKQVQMQSSAFLAPIREGGGSKLKVLEAMAAGLPVISTTQGVSGLHVQTGKHCLITDQVDDFSQGILQLLDSELLARQLSRAARQYVKDFHDWEIAAKQLEKVYEEVMVACE